MINLLRLIFGVHSVHDGSTCRLEGRFGLLAHDYHTDKGGDGFPSCFHTYTCPKCGHTFTI